jgi:SsrA-binding protein
LTSAGAAAVLLPSVSWIALVLRRIGGWRHVLRPLNGAFAGRIHVEVARVAVFGLLLSSLTALWMTASTFGFLPEAAGPPAFPKVSGQGDFATAQMRPLQKTRVSALRDLTFPYPGDLTDAFALRTDAGEGFFDQGTGSLLAWGPLSGWDQVSETIYMLHTGQGASLLGLIHGMKALGVPVMAASGPWMWGAARWVWPRMRGTMAAGQAETIVLVGSEVKSLRTGQVQLADAYARVMNHEVWLEGVHIAPYRFAVGVGAHDPDRPRKLLLHATEIRRFRESIMKDRLTLVPLSFILRDGRVKVELALAQGRKHADKRQAIAERDVKREIQRELGRKNKGF